MPERQKTVQGSPMYNSMRTDSAPMQPAPQSTSQLTARSMAQRIMGLLDLKFILKACAVLILFSSTSLAGQASEYVYNHFLDGFTSFYFAQKSVHVTLFAIFGSLCYRVLPRSRLVEYLTRNCCRGTTCDIACAPKTQRGRRRA